MIDDLTHVLATARGWIADGHRAAIATVVDTWGSAPRRKGSHAVIRDDGLFEGSVSGGCVEGEVIVAAQGLTNAAGGAVRLDFGVADEAAWQAGLACGGEISVLVQSIDESHFPVALLDRIADERAAGRSLRVATDLVAGHSVEAGLLPAGDDAFENVYQPPLRMMIVGAVHIAQSLAPMAALAGYRPLIVDPREGYAASSRFTGFEVDTRWSDEAIEDWRPDAATAVVTLAHDPKIDDPALIAALRSDAYYIAALGSRRTHAKRIERLAASGFGEPDLARIEGPAGLAIGAVTPPEIALSILAGAVAAWRRRQP
jgi:xanthine dehydrogenase accessory factor